MDPRAPITIQERFEDFHQRHPEVYTYMLALVMQLYRRGWQHYGIRSIYERTRWHFHVDRDQRDEYKLNDHYHSRYARLLIKEHPELDGFFELRTLKAP